MNIFALRGLLLGLILAALVYLVEQTTPEPSWLLVLSFPVCLTIGGHLFWIWDIGGYKSDREQHR
jgi:cobalamin synthase